MMNQKSEYDRLKQVMLSGLTTEQQIAFKGLARVGIDFIDLKDNWVVSRVPSDGSKRELISLEDMKKGDTVVLQKGSVASKQGVVLKDIKEDVYFKDGVLIVDATINGKDRILTTADKELTRQAAIDLQRICATSDYYVEMLNNEFLQESMMTGDPNVKVVENAQDFDKNNILMVAGDVTFEEMHKFVIGERDIESRDLGIQEFDDPFALDSHDHGFEDLTFDTIG